MDNSEPTHQVVLIHGMFCHPAILSPLRDYLQSHTSYTIHCPALPQHGVGQNRIALRKLGLRDYRQTILDYLCQHNIERPILIGHSMGGLVAQMVAATIEVHALVLLNSAAPAGINHIFPSSFWSTRQVYWKPFFWKWTSRPSLSIAKFAFFNAMDVETAKAIHDTLVYESGRSYSELVYWWLDPTRASRIDGAVSGKKLIVIGLRDHIVVPHVGRQLAKRYPDAEVIELPEHAHWLVHETGQEAIFQQLTSWLDKS